MQKSLASASYCGACSQTHSQRMLAPLTGLRHGFASPSQFLRGSFAGATSVGGTLSRSVQVAHARESRSLPLVTQAGMNIAFVSAEVAPWSKTGGLGDVLGGLPVALAKRGHHVLTIAPRYDQYHDAWDTSVVIDVEGESVRFFHTFKQGVHRVWIDHPLFLARVWGMTGAKLYGLKSGSDFVDNQKRFRLFCKAAIEALRVLPCSPGEECVVVANDWHSALVPVYLKDVYQPRGEFTKTKVAMCVHNIAFQGRFWKDSFEELGLPASSAPKFEFLDGYHKLFDENSPADEDEFSPPPKGAKYLKINWLKAGFLAADKLLTVSPNYAREVSSDDEKGVELYNTILLAGGIEGIVNGMDVTEWNPKTDKYLTVKFDKSSVAVGKAAAKAALQAEAGLPVKADVPLFGFIGRLEEQKGVDILLKAIPKFIATTNCQVVILGTGKKQLEGAVKALSKAFPGKCAGVVKFSAPMAHKMAAGCDFMLVPSRFEPCGLIQLQAMQYGTVPVVSSTGGLVDTVKEGVTGFHMGAFDPDMLTDADVDAIVQTVKRAADVYKTQKYKDMVSACISQDLTWDKPAIKWEATLLEMKTGGQEGTAQKQSIATPVQKVENPALVLS